MEDAGIFDGDILVVDRSLEPAHRKIVVAAVDGELTVKRLILKDGKVQLLAEKKGHPPIKIAKESELRVWGVVVSSIRTL